MSTLIPTPPKVIEIPVPRAFAYRKNTMCLHTSYFGAEPLVGEKFIKGLSLLRQPLWWEMVDSNHRSHQTTDLQSAPIGRSGNLPCLVFMRVLGQLRFVVGSFPNRINYDTGGEPFCQPPSRALSDCCMRLSATECQAYL